MAFRNRLGTLGLEIFVLLACACGDTERIDATQGAETTGPETTRSVAPSPSSAPAIAVPERGAASAEPAREGADQALLSACPGVADLDLQGRRLCTQVGCRNGFEVTLVPEKGWRAGDYRFVLRHDGVTVTCEAQLPLRPCDERSVRCDREGVRIVASGCALDPAEQGFTAISVDGFPRAVGVRIERDGERVAEGELGPRYRLSQPNGAGCPPACCSAADRLAVAQGT